MHLLRFKKFESIDKEELSYLLVKSIRFKTILFFCLKCRKNTESENQRVLKREKGRVTVLPNGGVCDSKKLEFIKKQEPSEILGNMIGTKLPVIVIYLYLIYCFRSYCKVKKLMQI